MIFIGIYVIGYLLTLLFLVVFGKKLGIDYDNRPRDYSNMEDWDSDARAYTAFSFAWPVMWCGGFIYVSAKSLVWFTKFLMGKL